MHDQSLLLFMRAVSALHPGSGEGLGYIDRPIQRRSDNQHPKMEGSGVKGVLREAFRKIAPEENGPQGKISALFGPERQDESQKSALTVEDARILLFPVSSPVGNTLYITCPLVLQQFKAEHQRQQGFAWNFMMPQVDDYNMAYCLDGASNQDICFQEKLMLHRTLCTRIENLNPDLVDYLSDSLFRETDSFYLDFYRKRIVVVHDDVFAFFVRFRTEVITGNRIDPGTGVVASGALFNFEYLPEGSVLYTWLETGPEKKKDGLSAQQVYAFLKNGLSQTPYLIMGGRTTVGKGQVAQTFREAISTPQS